MEDALSFEEAVSRLEHIVCEMEAGSLPLHECLLQFEQAVALSRLCAEQLDTAEQRIRVLTPEQGMQTASGLTWAGIDGS